MNTVGQPRVNRAIIYSDPGTTSTEVVELEIPEPGPGEVLVRLEFSGVCHTDYVFCTNAIGAITPKAAPLMCGGISTYAALKRAGVRSGDWVLVVGGGGGIGHIGLQYAVALGARVLAMDVGAKEAFCRDLGAQAFVDFTAYGTDEALTAAVKEITGGGARVVLMCSSSAKAYVQSVSWLGFGGTLCCLGVLEGQDVGIVVGPAMSILSEELSIIGVKTGTRLEAAEALDLASKGAVRPRHQLRRMSSLTKIFQEMEAGQIKGRAVIDLR